MKTLSECMYVARNTGNTNVKLLCTNSQKQRRYLLFPVRIYAIYLPTEQYSEPKTMLRVHCTFS